MKASFTAFVAFLIAFLVVSTIAWQDAAAAEANSETVAVEPAQPELPDWRRYAALSKESGEAPIIAVVIDDLGHSEGEFSRVMALGEGITLAFLPYTARVAEYAQRARAKGFEILVHMPMEPTDSSVDPGPNALLTGIGDSELMRRLSHNLSRLAGYVGINNHMG
ncbi:MAG: divergent polysaccharide deacetylase family protein, partial [Pseudomonadota bacterium]|nr:divergent polysaccharide deacetylase family protein [Pseudomonadota bacterium]